MLAPEDERSDAVCKTLRSLGRDLVRRGSSSSARSSWRWFFQAMCRGEFGLARSVAVGPCSGVAALATRARGERTGDRDRGDRRGGSVADTLTESPDWQMGNWVPQRAVLANVMASLPAGSTCRCESPHSDARERGGYASYSSSRSSRGSCAGSQPDDSQAPPAIDVQDSGRTNPRCNRWTQPARRVAARSRPANPGDREASAPEPCSILEQALQAGASRWSGRRVRRR